LGDPVWTDERAGLDDGEPCGGQALDEPDLRLHRQDLSLVLEPIAGSHLDHPNPPGQPGRETHGAPGASGARSTRVAPPSTRSPGRMWTASTRPTRGTRT